MKTGNYDAFMKLTVGKIEYNISSMPDEISAALKEHLIGLQTNLKKYFSPIHRTKTWIRNPFIINIESETELLDSDTESMVELSWDTTLKDSFDKIRLMDFWLSCRQDYL